MLRRRQLFQSALLALPAWAQKTGTYAYTGCYTTEKRHGHGDGIHVYSVNSDTGDWTHVQHVGGLTNPSFLITSHDQRFVYSVHGDEQYATAFAIDRATGYLTVLNTGDTGGVNGVHSALSKDGRFLVVANYGSGSVAVLPVGPDGRLANQMQLIALEGQPGPHRVEQAASHPHHVVFDPSGRFVLVPDKGLDRVFVFRFDAANGRLRPTEQGSLLMRAGSGPRHLAFHPLPSAGAMPLVYVVNELNSSITTCAWDPANGALKPVRILPTLPPEFTGESTAAEIAVSGDGRFVYVSNRGHDSIAVFSAHPKTGVVTASAWKPAGGKTPRFIGLDPSGHFLCAANEQGDTVTRFRVNPGTGALAPLVPPVTNLSPVTVAFARF